MVLIRRAGSGRGVWVWTEAPGTAGRVGLGRPEMAHPEATRTRSAPEGNC